MGAWEAFLLEREARPKYNLSHIEVSFQLSIGEARLEYTQEPPGTGRSGEGPRRISASEIFRIP